MTRKEAKEIFDKSSDNAISYHDSTEVISIASAEIIIDKIYEDFEKQLESIQKELEELIEKDKSKNCEESYDKTKLAIKALENRSCSNCKRVNSCKLASDVVDNFGTKLREQWFYCWEQK